MAVAETKVDRARSARRRAWPSRWCSVERSRPFIRGLIVVTVCVATAAGCGAGVEGASFGGGGASTGGLPAAGGAPAPGSGGSPGIGTGGGTVPGTGGGTGGAATGGWRGAAGRPGSGGAATSTGSGGAANTGIGGAPTNGGPGGTGPSTDGPAPTMLPTPKGTCPTIASGNLTFLGQPVTVWAGVPSASQRGPVVIYWYATGSNPQEAVRGLGQAAITEITNAGGIVAAPGATNRMGTNTGNGVWYTGDFQTADEVVACAVQQLHVDTRRIYASGFSAGGLQTTRMAYDRSGYLAAVVPYSGGLTGFGAAKLQDPSNVPRAMVVHGAAGSDVVVIDFAQASASYEADVKAKGGFSIDCNHGGGHTIPSAILPSTWAFMKAHPFRGSPEPFAGGIPAGFPAYCQLP